MASSLILKDICEIHSRLFHHRPALQTEIHTFVQEFETRRGNRDVSRLQQSNESCREINEHLLPQTESLIKQHLPNIQASINKALSVCEELDKITTKTEDENSWLQQKRHERVDEWATFMQDMTKQSDLVDQRHGEDLARLENYYKDLEEKLNIHV